MEKPVWAAEGRGRRADMTKEEFRKMVSSGPVILDGATGTNLFAAGMPHGVSTELWVLENPEVIQKLQREYIEAGSQIIYTPTFGANRAVLSRFGMQDHVRDMNLRLAGFSLSVSAGRALTAGDLSPTGKLPVSAGGDMPDEQIFEIYREQAAALLEAGVDLVVVESMMSVTETLIACDAVNDATGGKIPVIASMLSGTDGHTYYDGTVYEALPVLESEGISAFGVNCNMNPVQLETVVRNLAGKARISVLAKPNAGLPVFDKKGNATYDMDAETFAKGMAVLYRDGASLLGGCCGTDPDFIRAMKKQF